MTDYLAGKRKSREREIAAAHLLELLPIRGAVGRRARPPRDSWRRKPMSMIGVTLSRSRATVARFHSQGTADWVAAFPTDGMNRA
jgi:hypothetical protein